VLQQASVSAAVEASSQQASVSAAVEASSHQASVSAAVKTAVEAGGVGALLALELRKLWRDSGVRVGKKKKEVCK
jgi:hypothetical protein